MEWEYFEEAQRIEFALYECVKARFGEAETGMGWVTGCTAKPMDKVYWADKVEAYEKLGNRKNENVKIYFIAGTGAACYKSIQNNNNAKGGNEPCFIQY